MMTFAEIMTAQLTDPFRIILLIALFWTMLRNQKATGTVLPLLAGAVFVAVLIPNTLTASSTIPLWPQIWAGLATNLLLLTGLCALWFGAKHLRGAP